MSNLRLSKLSFGTGGRFGRLTNTEAFDLVAYAYKKGITVFDTGIEYSKGRSAFALQISFQASSWQKFLFRLYEDFSKVFA